MLTWSNLHLLGISRQTLDTPMSKLDKARSVTMEIQWRDVNNSWELFVLYNFLGFQKYIDFVSYFDTAKEYRISCGRWIQTSTLSSTFFYAFVFLKYKIILPGIPKSDSYHLIQRWQMSYEPQPLKCNITQLNLWRPSLQSLKHK